MSSGDTAWESKERIRKMRTPLKKNLGLDRLVPAGGDPIPFHLEISCLIHAQRQNQLSPLSYSSSYPTPVSPPLFTALLPSLSLSLNKYSPRVVRVVMTDRPRELTAMEAQEQLVKSRVLKVDSQESWEHHMAQANNQGCPVIVHFTASWCVPSIAMNPFFESLAQSHEDALFLLVDVDDVKSVAAKMEVKAMPTFVFMREGKVVDKVVGANPDEIRKRADGFLLSPSRQADVESV